MSEEGEVHEVPFISFNPKDWDDSALIKAFEGAVKSYGNDNGDFHIQENSSSAKKKKRKRSRKSKNEKVVEKKNEDEKKDEQEIVMGKVIRIEEHKEGEIEGKEEFVNEQFQQVPFPPAPTNLQDLLNSYYWAGYQMGLYAGKNSF